LKSQQFQGFFIAIFYGSYWKNMHQIALKCSASGGKGGGKTKKEGQLSPSISLTFFF